jgi:hypothetical protein
MKGKELNICELLDADVEKITKGYLSCQPLQLVLYA